jgi:hypothetical protein
VRLGQQALIAFSLPLIAFVDEGLSVFRPFQETGTPGGKRRPLWQSPVCQMQRPVSPQDLLYNTSVNSPSMLMAVGGRSVTYPYLYEIFTFTSSIFTPTFVVILLSFGSNKEGPSMDAVYLCLIVGFFALSWLLLKLLERI